MFLQSCTTERDGPGEQRSARAPELQSRRRDLPQPVGSPGRRHPPRALRRTSRTRRRPDATAPSPPTATRLRAASRPRRQQPHARRGTGARSRGSSGTSDSSPRRVDAALPVVGRQLTATRTPAAPGAIACGPRRRPAGCWPRLDHGRPRPVAGERCLPTPERRPRLSPRRIAGSRSPAAARARVLTAGRLRVPAADRPRAAPTGAGVLTATRLRATRSGSPAGGAYGRAADRESTSGARGGSSAGGAYGRRSADRDSASGARGGSSAGGAYGRRSADRDSASGTRGGSSAGGAVRTPECGPRLGFGQPRWSVLGRRLRTPRCG